MVPFKRNVTDGVGGTSMSNRLQRLNGWRRLWLVATAGAAIWFVVVWPMHVWSELKYCQLLLHRDIEKDFASGQCRTYQTAPLEKLQEPPSTRSDCWHIHTSRNTTAQFRIHLRLTKAIVPHGTEISIFRH